jgi:hypothetical protein
VQCHNGKRADRQLLHPNAAHPAEKLDGQPSEGEPYIAFFVGASGAALSDRARATPSLSAMRHMPGAGRAPWQSGARF